MKSFIVLALLVAAAVAAPASLSADSEAQILRFDSDNIGVGGYNYNVQTSNGINVEESGQLVDVGTENEGIAVRGQFSYVGPDGVTYQVVYVADKNGFQPSAPHIPQNN